MRFGCYVRRKGRHYGEMRGKHCHNLFLRRQEGPAGPCVLFSRVVAKSKAFGDKSTDSTLLIQTFSSRDSVRPSVPPIAHLRPTHELNLCSSSSSFVAERCDPKGVLARRRSALTNASRVIYQREIATATAVIANPTPSGSSNGYHIDQIENVPLNIDLQGSLHITSCPVLFSKTADKTSRPKDQKRQWPQGS